MKNLDLLKLRRLPVASLNGDIIHKLKHEVYFLKDESLYCFDSIKQETIELNVNVSKLIDITYLSIEDKLCLVTSEKVILIAADSKEVLQVEFPKPVAAFAWNSALETAAAVYEDGMVCSLNLDMETGEPVEKGASSVGASVPERSNVGWGSQDTQFQGASGKKSKQTDVKDAPIEDIEDTTPQISWRGNGETFAVNYYEDGRRFFKVFGAACTPLNSSEPVRGLQPSIAWKPEGSLIACCAYDQGKSSVVFFEKNGLVKRQVDVYFATHKIKSLQWSPCSRVLNVVQDVDGVTHVCLYTENNYVWYLKQDLAFTLHKPTDIKWSNAVNKYCVKLVVTTREEIISYTYKFEATVAFNNNYAVVIAGDTLRLHDFTRQSMPPPLCSREINIGDPINFVQLHPDQTMGFLITSKNELVHFDFYDEFSDIEFIRFDVSTAEKVPPLCNHHVFWYEQCPHYLQESENPDKVNIIIVSVNRKEVACVRTIDSGVMHMVSYDDILVQQYETVRTVYGPGRTMRDEPAILAVRVIPYCIGAQVQYWSLAPNDDLYLNDELFASDVTSILVYREYFLLVRESTFYCARQSRDDDMFPLKLEYFYERKVNEIISLVSAVPNTGGIVLQTARGNLEISSCNLLSVDILESYLEMEMWVEALYYIRTEKLNWNLLIDLDPFRFFEHLVRILAAAKESNILNALCMEIKEENVFFDAYLKCYPGEIPVLEGKKNMFFGQLINFLERTGVYIDHIQTLMLICVHHFSVGRALVYLQDLVNKMKEDDSKELREFVVSALDSIKQYVPNSTLFKEALLLFDVDFAEFIASHGNMDPRDYEPTLNKYREMTEMGRRFEICLEYEVYTEAVRYMMRDENRTERDVIVFVKTYKVAEEAYREYHAIHPDVTEVSNFEKKLGKEYAILLINRHAIKDAIALFLRIKMFDEVIPACIIGLEWRKMLHILPETSFDDAKKKEFTQKMAKRLCDNRRYTEAALIYEQYMNNWEEAFNILVQGSCFHEAVLLSKTHGPPEHMCTVMIPAVLERMRVILEEATNGRDSFRKYLERLNELRDDKRQSNAQKQNRYVAQPKFSLNLNGDDKDKQSKTSNEKEPEASTASSSVDVLYSAPKYGSSDATTSRSNESQDTPSDETPPVTQRLAHMEIGDGDTTLEETPKKSYAAQANPQPDTPREAFKASGMPTESFENMDIHRLVSASTIHSARTKEQVPEDDMRARSMFNLETGLQDPVASSSQCDTSVGSQPGPSYAPSMGSVVSSATHSSRSTSSRSSQRTAIKQMKKKLDTRPGSVYEDIAIIRTLHELIEVVFQYGIEAREILFLLLESSDKSIRYLKEQQDVLLDIQNEMIGQINTIWPDEMDLNNSEPAFNHLNENLAVMDEEYRTFPPIVQALGTLWLVPMLK